MYVCIHMYLFRNHNEIKFPIPPVRDNTHRQLIPVLFLDNSYKILYG